MDNAPIVLITGAARGLGRVMAMTLLKEGCSLILTATSEGPLQQIVDDAGAGTSQCVVVAADLSQEKDRLRLIETASQRFGHVDVVVNNAAFTPEHLWPDFELSGEALPWTIPLETQRKFYEVNTVAPHHLAAAYIPSMIDRGWGRIINLSTSLDTMLRFWPYGSTKAAFEAYTAVLAKGLEGTGVTANALLPGGFTKAEPLRNSAGDIVRPVLPPSNMIAPIVWLCSRASDGVSGRRILASEWNADLPDTEALARASYPVAWTGLGVKAAMAV